MTVNSSQTQFVTRTRQSVGFTQYSPPFRLFSRNRRGGNTVKFHWYLHVFFSLDECDFKESLECPTLGSDIISEYHWFVEVNYSTLSWLDIQKISKLITRPSLWLLQEIKEMNQIFNISLCSRKLCWNIFIRYSKGFRSIWNSTKT